MAVDIIDLSEVGRMLSRKNETDLRAAVDTIQTILAKLDKGEGNPDEAVQEAADVMQQFFLVTECGCNEDCSIASHFFEEADDGELVLREDSENRNCNHRRCTVANHSSPGGGNAFRAEDAPAFGRGNAQIKQDASGLKGDRSPAQWAKDMENERLAGRAKRQALIDADAKGHAGSEFDKAIAAGTKVSDKAKDILVGMLSDAPNDDNISAGLRTTLDNVASKIEGEGNLGVLALDELKSAHEYAAQVLQDWNPPEGDPEGDAFHDAVNSLANERERRREILGEPKKSLRGGALKANPDNPKVTRERYAAHLGRGGGKGKRNESADGKAPNLIEGEPIELLEKAVRRDGTVPIKVISPGWGTSGYYSPAVLERDGPKVFKKGTKMFWDHPTPAEESGRPERSLRDLAAELTGDARWMPDGPTGPGLYADAKVFSSYRDAIDELAPHIGTSIRAHGSAKVGEAEGRKGRIVENLISAASVDFVTTPGRGGEILSLFESARGMNQEAEETDVSVELREALRERDEALQETARLQTAFALREAKDIAADTVGKVSGLPDISKIRVAEACSLNPPLVEEADGKIKLDKDELVKQCNEAATKESAYLAELSGAGKIRGVGSRFSESGAPADDAKTTDELADVFKRMGLSESAAKSAAGGRGH